MSSDIKIMVIDDDPDVALFLKTKLEKKEGYTVVSTDNSAEALSLAENELPNLIICDIDMPGLSGGDVFNELSQSDVTEDIPVLFFSSLVTTQDVQQSGGVISGRPTISKSSSIDEIIARIKSMI